MSDQSNVLPRALHIPGRNCWRLERARRVAFLVDGEACFAAMRAALAQAQRSIFILGWDIDSRMHLVPRADGDGSDDGLPAPLGDFLDALVRRRRGLRVNVLSWDFAMLYTFEREWLPVYRLGRRTHRRLSFRLDGEHPLGASHHQKLVVVDDAVAFVGGLDLTRCRWDTPAHRIDEPRRRDAGGKAYGPFHDVQAAVDGDAARALGQLARERWRHAGGKCGDVEPAGDAWPASLVPDLTDVDVAIVRTEPAYLGRTAIEETRHWLLDAIAAARHRIFIENQYFTASAIGDALAARLEAGDGPEIAVITGRVQSGWLEENTMGVLRARLHRRLRTIDRHGRYRALCPRLPGDGVLNVHSKVVVLDEDCLLIGSANLSNRSMGLDTECGIALEARGDSRIRTAIAGLRDRLLAEHLDVASGDVAAAIGSYGLLGAINTLGGKPRTLIPTEFECTPELDALIPEHAVFDPEQPLAPDRLVEELVPPEVQWPLRRRIAAGAALVFVFAAFVALWLWTPLREWVDVDHMIGLMQTLADAPFAPALILGAYVAGGLVVFPVNVLIAVSVIVCGPLIGALYALAGSTLSAAFVYEIGRCIGRDSVRRLANARLNRLSRRLAQRGLLAVVFVRIVPVAPYSLVNLVAGAARVNRRDYLLGTALGMLPGITMTALFIDRAIAAIRHPSLLSAVLLAAVVGVLIAVMILLGRRAARADWTER